MNAYAVKQNRRTPALAKRHIQPADYACAIFKRSISHANVRTDRYTGVVLQALAHRRVERLPEWRADSIRARADNQCRPLMCFRDDNKICEWTNFSGQRVVFNTRGKARVKTISQSVTPRRPIDLFGDQSDAVCPSVIVISNPAHGAAFTRSKRSTRYG